LLIFIVVHCFAQGRPQNGKTEEMRDAAANDLFNRALENPHRVMRPVDDGSLRWLLIKNQQDPSGPGRLLPVQALSRISAADSVRCVIKAGDRVIAEEHTAGFDARFEAIALESTYLGAHLNVRLKLGGKTVDAIAKGPGLVVLATGIEGRR
jgi:hypothetical protein